MNRAKGNMYGFVTHTWNPLGGKCQHKCPYCSTNKLRHYKAVDNKYSGEYRLSQMDKSLGSGNFIFVCAQNDLFEGHVPNHIIKAILNRCEQFPDNRYFFQTKNPYRIIAFKSPAFYKSVICTTIETHRHTGGVMKNVPAPIARYSGMIRVNEWNEENGYDAETHITVEPIMDMNPSFFADWLLKLHPTQINIGADSGNNNLPEPYPGVIEQFVRKLLESGKTKVHIKSNLERLVDLKGLMDEL